MACRWLYGGFARLCSAFPDSAFGILHSALASGWLWSGFGLALGSHWGRNGVPIAWLAEWAMAREQRDRYANMGDLAEDLRRICAGRAPIGPHGLALQWPWSFVLKRK